MAKPTRDDAQLMVQLAQFFVQSGAAQAGVWIWSDGFESEYEAFKERFGRGSTEWGHVAAMAGFHETVGTLWKHDLFSEELLFDWLAPHLLWDRMKGIVLGFRDESGEPRLYENFEAMAARAREL